METHRVIGLMSGTSIDGLDIAYCQFTQENHLWNFEILHCETAAYSDQWLLELSELAHKKAEEFAKVDVLYGYLIGQLVLDFITKNELMGKVDFVSSHGQTIFHNPNELYTTQIGKGSSIAAECGLTTICDFRSTDVAYGGQGAPIVAVGERDLFPDYHVFLNLGGISNIQIHGTDITGYDICSANLLTDRLANLIDQAFDYNGSLARSGTVSSVLLHKLNSMRYISKEKKITLHAEDIIKEAMPIIQDSGLTIEDSMATVVEHVSDQIARAVTNEPIPDNEQILVTGGGALNSYLIERIQAKLTQKVVVPDDTNIINFKEALIIAYLGVLRIKGIPNVLQTVTGASKDSCNGCVYLP